ncbi:MAG: hydroxylamine reductase [Anaerolineae bacterium]
MFDVGNMFCYQCQEALNGGCTKVGACGKTPEVAALQDLLVWQLKGLSFWAVKAREFGLDTREIDLFTAQALFSTITNVNFDPERLADLNRRALTLRDELMPTVRQACLQATGSACPGPNMEAAIWQPADTELATLITKGRTVGVMAELYLDEDVRSLRELLTYGLKGLAAYTEHAYILDKTQDELLHFLQEGLLAAAKTTDAGELISWVMRAGEMGVKAMALLDEANTSAYGNPSPTAVSISVKEGPAILISGHDLRDLEELLEQTAGTGVNVYTHGEMLPAHAYPAFQKYPHFVGNYGGSWPHQQHEFEKFNGAILMTTNCIVRPRESYRDRLFTTGLVAFPGIQHIPDRQDGQPKDFSPVIKKALECGSPEPLEDGSVMTGFSHTAVLSVADQVVDAIKSGAIKRFVVMAGCDGRHPEREYYTELARNLPQDHVILAAGCAKYRYNKLDLGDIGGIPRILDAGQCNDSYSLVVVAQKLAEVFGVEDINDLPISYDIAWYEQKAVIVLLALLYLGVKNIRLGTSLPAFVSPGVLKVLVEQFNIMPIESVESDLAAITAGV